MKLKITAIIVVLLAIVLSVGSFYQTNASEQEKLISELVYTALQKWHFSDVKLDQKFCDRAFKEYLESLDYGKRFLLKSDVNELSKYKNNISLNFAEGNFELMKAGTKIMDQRIHQVMDFYGELLSKPFDFSKAETIESDSKKRDFCSSMDELKDYWRKTFKYMTLLRYLDKLKEKSTEKSAEPQKSPAELEAEARQSVLKNFKSTFNRMLQGNQNDAFSRYMNSLIQVYDPHSIFFPPVDKETFDMQISGTFEGIGATLQNEDEYVKIVNIVPGSPAWRQKELKAGDMIIKVAQGKEEPTDIIGMRTEDAVKLIRGKKGTTVRLWVKKPSGQIKEVSLIRDVIILEETFAKSAVITHIPTGKRIGYIVLPGFYDDFSDRKGRTSSSDVKKELEKLKIKNVEGIILDLRNNGGGALKDAVQMAGLFIPKGPIVQVKDKRNRIDVLEDKDTSVTFNGPLIIMINELSASASEILAGALQDYKRAVIVGSNSYGKGTVQAMLNLDQFAYETQNKDQQLGALTVTIQQFFRVSGSSTQKKGITPDIILPDQFDSLEIGERFLENALEWNAVPTAPFVKTDSLPSIEVLSEKSSTRVSKSPSMEQIKEYTKRVKQLREDTLQSLKIDDVMKEREQAQSEADKLDKMKVDSSKLSVEPSSLPLKKESESLEKVSQELQDDWFKRIKEDIMLNETIEIMNDLVNLQPVKKSK